MTTALLGNNYRFAPASTPHFTFKVVKNDLPVDTLVRSSNTSDHYSAGKILARAAMGAIGGAATVYFSGGGIMATAMFGAGVYGAIGAVVGGVTGAIAGAAASKPGTGAIVGVVAGAALGAGSGFIKGAILGGVAGLFGGGPIAGAIAGGLISAATT